MFTKLLAAAFLMILGIGATLGVLGSEWAADLAQTSRDWLSTDHGAPAAHAGADNVKALSADELGDAIESEIAQCARRAAETAADAAVVADEADGLGAQITRLDDQIRAEEQLLHRLRPLLAEQRPSYEFNGRQYSFVAFATDVERRALALERLRKRRADLNTRLGQLRRRLAGGEERQVEFRARLEQLRLDFDDLVYEKAFAAQDAHLAKLISAVDNLPTGMDDRLGRLLREYRRRIAADRAMAGAALNQQTSGISYGPAEPVGQRAREALDRVLDTSAPARGETVAPASPRTDDQPINNAAVPPLDNADVRPTAVPKQQLSADFADGSIANDDR